MTSKSSRVLLGAIKGRFIMTINDRPEIRDMFSQFMVTPVELSYRVAGKPTPARELIVTSHNPGLTAD